MRKAFWKKIQNKYHKELSTPFGPVLFLLVAISAFAYLPKSAVAQAPDDSTPAAENTQQPPQQDSETLIREMQTTLSMHAHEQLTQKIDDYLSRRLDRNNYRFDISFKVNLDMLHQAASKLGSIEEDIFLKSLAESEYITTRRYLDEAKVVVTVADFINVGEAKEIVSGLESAIKGGNEGPEVFSLRTAKFAPSALERSVLLQSQQAKRNSLDEIRAKEQVERGIEKMRQDFETQQTNKRVKDLEDSLAKERKKKEELAEQFDTESLKEKLRRELPALFRHAALGSGFGVFALIAFGLLMTGIILAATRLGRFFVEGSSEVAAALKDRGSASNGQPLLIQQSPQGNTGAQEGSGERFHFQQEIVVALKEISEELRLAVEADINTAAALISKQVACDEIPSVFALFEILGSQIAQKLFEELPAPDKKQLRQYFYSGARRTLNLAQVYNVALSFRAGLNSTSIVVADSAERSFAHLLLSHSNEELAAALSEIPVERSLKVLAAIPAERAAQIIKASNKKLVLEWVSGIGTACQNAEPVDFEDVRLVKESIVKPDRVKFDESKTYLKSLMSQLDEDVADELLKGLQRFPALLSAVSGNRATLEDLWAQSAENVFKLIGNLELRQAALLLFVAPDGVRSSVVEQFTGRRRERFDEEFGRVQTMDEDERLKAIQANSPARKKVLETLANWADSGRIPQLPSRVGETDNNTEAA